MVCSRKVGLIPVKVPTFFEDYGVGCNVDRRAVELQLRDTSKQERSTKNPHPESVNLHVILLCFALDAPESLENAQKKVGNHAHRYNIEVNDLHYSGPKRLLYSILGYQ